MMKEVTPKIKMKNGVGTRMMMTLEVLMISTRVGRLEKQLSRLSLKS